MSTSLSDDDRTTPIGLFNYADSYFVAAQKLRSLDLPTTHPAAPVLFLYSHTVELYMKAYLRRNGETLNELRSRKLGHDLLKLMKRSEDFGIDFDDEDQSVFQLLVDGNIFVGARYIKTGYFKQPDFSALDKTCGNLRTAVASDLKRNGLPVRMTLPKKI